MLGTLAQFFLNFAGSVHCDHIVWKIVKIFLNDPLQNIMGTFVGNFLNIPNNSLIGKLKSHGLVHCKSAEHVLHLGYCRDIGSEYSKYTYNMLARYVLSILAQVLTLYSACNGSVHHPFPPVLADAAGTNEGNWVEVLGQVDYLLDQLAAQPKKILGGGGGVCWVEI